MLRSVYIKHQGLIWNISVNACIISLCLISFGIVTHFWSDSLSVIKKSKQFDQCDIASYIAALTLTLIVNGPLGDHLK